MKTFLTTIILLLSVAIQCHGESPLWLGSMTPYNTTISPEGLPDSLEPVGVVHIARHGARYMTSDKAIENLRQAIENVAQEHHISKTAEEMLEVLHQMDNATDNQWGMLDSVGYNEEISIATHFRADMEEALKRGSVEAWSTYVPRAIMSMYAFTYRLGMLSPYLNIQTHEGPRQDALLRFFDTDSTYVAYLATGAWKEVCKKYEKDMVSLRPALALVGPESGLSDKELQALTMDAYNVLRSAPASGLDISATPFFTDEELEACWKVANLKHYLQRTHSTLSDIPTRAARPLLRKIIEDIDLVSNLNQPVRAMLYFGHAETLMPLFSLMNLPGCNAPDVPYDEVWAHWQDSEVVPLGANLDIEVWLDAQGRLLISTVLNGKRIPIEEGGGLTTPWSEVKKAWIELIN